MRSRVERLVSVKAVYVVLVVSMSFVGIFPAGGAAFAKRAAASAGAGDTPGGTRLAAAKNSGMSESENAADSLEKSVAVSPTAGQATEDMTSYAADVKIDPASKTATGSVHIRFAPRDPDYVYLHLYPLAFTEKKSGGLWLEILGKNAVPGTYHITKLVVQGKPASYQIDGTVVKVGLGKAVSAKEGELQYAQASTQAGLQATAQATAQATTQPIDLELDFEMTLPLNMGRMSYDEHAIWLGNWLPVLAVYDASGWHLDPYGPVGDPFYTETANYQVQLTIPAGYQFVSTATDRNIAGKELQTGEITYSLQAKRVRDFSLVIMDNTYQHAETPVGNTWVRSWWRQGDSAGQVKRNHEAAVKALAYFQAQFGAYPYPEYDTVRIGGNINGMEYPGIVFLDGSHYQGDHLSSIPTVVHETAHQWFYGLVGNNQVEEAWLDEGLAEYASLAFMVNAYPELAGEQVVGRMVRGTTGFYDKKGQKPWMALSRFPDNESYSNLVYSRTTTMLWLLREAWGEQRLHAMLRRFVAAHQHGIATGKGWVEALTAEAGEDASPFIKYWLLLDRSQEQAAEAWLDRQRAAKR